MKKRYLQLVSLLALTSCLSPQEGSRPADYQYKTQKVAKGNHFTKVTQRYWLPVRAQSFTIQASIEGPGLDYNIGAADQKDINKFAGFYGKKYRPHLRSSMQGFWNDLDRDRTAWTFYHHGIQNAGNYQAVGSVPGYVNLKNVIYTQKGEVPSYHVYFASRKEVHLAMIYQDQAIYDTIYFERKIDRWITLSNLYMGGNVPAQDWVKAHKVFLEYGLGAFKK